MMGTSTRLALAGALAFAAIATATAAETWKTGENEMAALRPHTYRWRDAVRDAAAATATVGVSPTLVRNGDWITVTVTVSAPTATDWVAAYVPAGIDITTTVPAKWSNLSTTAPNYLATGQATLSWRVVNMRVPLYIVVLTGGLVNAVALASSATVAFVDYNAPLKPRVSPTGNPDSLLVTWSSLNSTMPQVWWGTTRGGPYSNVVDAKTARVAKADLCGAPATGVGYFDLGAIHSATLTGLTPLARSPIFYVYGDAATGNLAAEMTLWLPPLPGDGTTPTRLVIYGDMGRGTADGAATWWDYGAPAINTTNTLLQYEIAPMVAAGGANATAGMHAIIHFGDLSYATGYLNIWDTWLDMIAPVAGSIVYAVSVGNHESDSPNTATRFNGTDSGGECGVATAALFPFPAPNAPTAAAASPLLRYGGAPSNTDTPWYSFNVGLAHIVQLSSEHAFDPTSPQYAWLAADLAAVNRSIMPWVIATLHRPMYIDSTYGGTFNSDLTVMAALQAALEPLFWQYRVNIALYGHNHAVQRLSAAYAGNLVQRSVARTRVSDNATIWHHQNPQATVHMVAGTAGAAFTVTRNTGANIPAWSELVFYRYGYARIILHNATHLDWEWVANDGGGAVLDRMSIMQTNASAPWVLPSAPPSPSLTAAAAAGIAAGVVVGAAAVILVVVRIHTGQWPACSIVSFGEGVPMGIAAEEEEAAIVDAAIAASVPILRSVSGHATPGATSPVGYMPPVVTVPAPSGPPVAPAAPGNVVIGPGGARIAIVRAVAPPPTGAGARG